VLQSSEPVVVDFHAEWCGPRAMAPALEQVAAEMKWQRSRWSLDVDANPDTNPAVSHPGDADPDDLQGRPPQPSASARWCKKKQLQDWINGAI
jgi:thioredoxin 1